MKRTKVSLMGAIAAGWLAIAAPQVPAAPQSNLPFIIKSALYEPCRATLRLEVANPPALSPTVFLGAFPAPLALVSSSATHLELSVPSSIRPGSYRLTVVVGNAPHEYDEAWVMLAGTCGS